MRKKVVLLVIGVLIVGILAFSSNTGSLFAAGKIIKGHRLYDENGVMNGCQSPGTDCEYTAEMPPPVN